jgi:type IV secretory pathway TrbL component
MSREMKNFNWRLWAGFVLVLFSLLSYPFLFLDYPVLRDFPWLNLILFVLALVFLILGLRRAFQPGRKSIAKISAVAVATLGVLIIAFFIFIAFIEARRLPASAGAPQVGQKAPEFTLTDVNDKPVMLAELLTQQINNKPAKGVLLIFYRGYW